MNYLKNLVSEEEDTQEHVFLGINQDEGEWVPSLNSHMVMGLLTHEHSSDHVNVEVTKVI